MLSFSLHKITAPVLAAAFAGLVFFSCTKEVGRLQQNCNTPVTTSFSKEILPLFAANCSISGCHSGSSPQGNLNLEAGVAYKNLSKKGSGYLDTINPGNSLLYAQMISTSDPMPPTGRLDACKLALLYKWIEQKARNN